MNLYEDDNELLTPLDAHNQALLDNVHPRQWTNPSPNGRCNLVVIGAGTAGLVTAAGAAGLGAKVALIERGLMGGDCLNFGCVPSKALLRCAHAAADVRDAGEYGVQVPQGVKTDFTAAMERLRRIRETISRHDSVERFKGLGVDVYLGDARFTGDGTIEVDGQTLHYKKAVIATGSRAVTPPIPGLAEAGFLTNETVFSLTECPSRFGIVGGGPIGVEMAQAFQRLGAQVTLIEAGPHIMMREDPEAAALVEQTLQHDGVEILANATLSRVEQSNGGKQLVIGHNGAEVVRDVDELLVAVGRQPNADSLNLESVNVSYDLRSGVEVDDTLRTTNPNIYACGDVCSKYKFTHAADAMARIVIQNALFGVAGKKKASKLVIPWCTYTDPEVAHVGLNEAAAQDDGIACDVIKIPLDDVDRAVCDGETGGFLKVLVKQGRDEILGATLVARNAGEMIGELTMAMTFGLGLKQLATVIHPYPTQAEVIKKAADAFNRKRVTPMVSKLFGAVLAIQR